MTKSFTSNVCAAIFSICAAACARGRGAGPEIVAPSLDVTRLRFAEYRYSPVGDFAAKRGRLFPFIDVNGNGKYDADEVVGHCDRRSGAGRCWIDRTRVSLVTTTSDCPGASGAWIIGSAFDGAGKRLTSKICDDRGACSDFHPNAFGDGVDLDAIWIPEAQDGSRHTLTLRAGDEVLRRDEVKLPPPLQLVDGQVDTDAGLHAHVSADQSIDLANIVLRSGIEVRWHSAGEPGTFQVHGNELDAVVPQAALDACGEGCEAVLSVAHVWSDDDVYSVSELRQKLL